MSNLDFTGELNRLFLEATALGAKSIVVKAGDLHRKLGGYPDSHAHRMPSCCAAMYEAQRLGDKTLHAPPKGKGATLTIEYHLPR